VGAGWAETGAAEGLGLAGRAFRFAPWPKPTAAHASTHNNVIKVDRIFIMQRTRKQSNSYDDLSTEMFANQRGGSSKDSGGDGRVSCEAVGERRNAPPVC
jgi:hypothetical protein